MIFRLYHVVAAKIPEVAMGTGREAEWPRDYVFVAEVDAGTLDDVFRQTNNSLADGSSWVLNPGVKAVGSVLRSTAPGDVAVAPNGKAYRFMLGDPEEVGPIQG